MKPEPDQRFQEFLAKTALIEPQARLEILEAFRELLDSILFHHGPPPGEKKPNPANATWSKPIETFLNHTHVLTQQIRSEEAAKASNPEPDTRPSDSGERS